MTEGLQISIPQRMTLVRFIIVLTFLVSMIFSHRLWTADSLFPVAALIDVAADPVVIGITLSSLLVFSLLGSLFLQLHRLMMFFSILFITALVLFDVNRVQWWVYLFAAMMLIFVIYNWRVDDPNKYTSYFIILQVMVASVYFFAGIQQLNSNFVHGEFETIIRPLRAILTERQFVFFTNLGVFVPFIMMFIALTLVITPLRYLGISLAFLMHVLLLIFIFPKNGGDVILWIMNISFPIIVFLLFSGKTKQRYFSPAFLFQKPVFYLTIVFFVAMPFLNLEGRWPDPLSFNIRSGNTYRMHLTLDQQAFSRMPLYVKAFCREQSEGNYQLDYNAWSLHETGVECYAADIAFLPVIRFVREFAGSGAVISITHQYKAPLYFSLD